MSGESTTKHFPMTSSEQILTSYKSGIPLGMVREQEEFRISIAGAQKTALLYLDGRWYLPLNATPTTHIIKLPIGKIESHSYSIDLSQSVENEYICTLIAKEFGLPVPHCFMMQVGQVKALVVERFDRRYAADRQLDHAPSQEDFCQVLNVPSARKYESHGGPGITDIMKTLLGSADTRTGSLPVHEISGPVLAAGGHRWPCQEFLGVYRTGRAFSSDTIYDILSMYPAFGGRGLHPRDAKLAMGLTATKGKKYAIEQIFPAISIRLPKRLDLKRCKWK